MPISENPRPHHSPHPSRRAFVTLCASDAYAIGASVLAQSLRKHHPHLPYPILCLYTPATLARESVQILAGFFDALLPVDPIISKNDHGLHLMGRPDLAISLTKLRVWEVLCGYERVLFMDADTLCLKPLDSLWQSQGSFAAAPDAGWPDCFNSGVFLCEPSIETFRRLESIAHKSFDGGDQGVLNEFFRDWTRLSFTFNTTHSGTAQSYTYAPAFRRFHPDIRVYHFVGSRKPWTFTRFSDGTVMTMGHPGGVMREHEEMLNAWWGVCDEVVRECGVFGENQAKWKMPTWMMRGSREERGQIWGTGSGAAQGHGEYLPVSRKHGMRAQAEEREGNVIISNLSQPQQLILPQASTRTQQDQSGIIQWSDATAMATSPLPSYPPPYGITGYHATYRWSPPNWMTEQHCEPPRADGKRRQPQQQQQRQPQQHHQKQQQQQQQPQPQHRLRSTRSSHGRTGKPLSEVTSSAMEHGATGRQTQLHGTSRPSPRTSGHPQRQVPRPALQRTAPPAPLPFQSSHHVPRPSSQSSRRLSLRFSSHGYLQSQTASPALPPTSSGTPLTTRDHSTAIPLVVSRKQAPERGILRHHRQHQPSPLSPSRRLPRVSRGVQLSSSQSFHGTPSRFPSVGRPSVISDTRISGIWTSHMGRQQRCRARSLDIGTMYRCKLLITRATQTDITGPIVAASEIPLHVPRQVREGEREDEDEDTVFGISSFGSLGPPSASRELAVSGPEDRSYIITHPSTPTVRRPSSYSFCSSSSPSSLSSESSGNSLPIRRISSYSSLPAPSPGAHHHRRSLSQSTKTPSADPFTTYRVSWPNESSIEMAAWRKFENARKRVIQSQLETEDDEGGS